MKPASSFVLLAPGPQGDLATDPYDRWLSPDDTVIAEFYRHAGGFLLRFPEQADFFITRDLRDIRCSPAPDMDEASLQSLFENSVRPALSNHAGSLNLHGSAVNIEGRALAVMGYSRRGKSTLAGALAMRGLPLLTEDVLAISRTEDRHTVTPQRASLRVFEDSAAFLLGSPETSQSEGEKRDIASGAIPVESTPVPLGAMCILGPGETEELSISPMRQSDILAEIMQHSFILDVEDKAALRSHFERLARLAEAIPCYALDYPRDFAQFSETAGAIATYFQTEWAADAGQ